MAEAQSKEDGLRQIAQMRAEHRQKVADLKKKRFSRLLTNMLLVIVFLTFSGVGLASVGYMQVFMFVAVGLLPGMAALITDSRPGRFASKTIIAFNLSGMTPHLASIGYSGSPNQTALAIMRELETWTLVYGFAGFGWVLVFLIPHIAALYLEVKATYTIKKLEEFKNALADEWGDKVKK